MKNLILTLCTITLLMSCKKDETPAIIDPVDFPVYGNLKVGNYWAYQHFLIDTNRVATPLDKFDTCYVEKDTVIDGYLYYKMIRPRLAPARKYIVYYWREYQGNIYDTAGVIRFSSEDFTTLFDTDVHYSDASQTDTSYVTTSKMVDKDKLVTTPAGEFVTLNYQTKYVMGAWWHGWHGGENRYSDKRFAKDIGIVTETLDIYSSVPTYTERRLVSYGNNTDLTRPLPA